MMEAIEKAARDTNVPREVLLRRTERYAREIVPSFNAWAYFRIGYVLARRAVQLLYRVRLGYSDDDALSRIESDASVVFVMNHRSNMDYVIVAYLAASRSALSYAVGEWARIWPLQTLIRLLGAYFVRRRSGDPLYRQVLARYVRAATTAGVVQAIYPEGNLSRDGRLRNPRLGLISYMVSAFDPDGERDLVFIPVGINYDRVLEDRLLVHELDPESDPYPRTHVVATLFRFVVHQAGLMLRRRWYRFGYACVNFGPPMSMRAYVRDRRIDFRGMDPATRFDAMERLGGELIDAVASAIPVVPVPLVATVFARRPDMPMSELEIKAKVHSSSKSCNGAARTSTFREETRLRGHGGTEDVDPASLRRGVGRDLPRQRARTGHAAVLRELHRTLSAGPELSRSTAIIEKGGAPHLPADSETLPWMPVRLGDDLSQARPEIRRRRRARRAAPLSRRAHESTRHETVAVPTGIGAPCDSGRTELRAGGSCHGMSQAPSRPTITTEQTFWCGKPPRLWVSPRTGSSSRWRSPARPSICR